LVGEGMVGTVIVNGSLHFSPKGTVSVFSLTDTSDGVTLKGLKYPLTDARLSARVPLGVSNSAFGTPAEISVKCGALYVLWEADSVDFRTVKRHRLS
jgi:thiamine pyrophosphokinase